MSAAPRPARRAPPPLAAGFAVFLDIDGTLLDLAPAPDAVHVDRALSTLLPKVRSVLGGALALITGRSITDVDRLFPGMRMAVAGQHGCERRDARGSLHLHAPKKTTLDTLRRLFIEFAHRHDGLLLEDKGATLALHYRKVPQLASHVHKTIRETFQTSGVTAYRLQAGKRILELRPDNRDKGTAIYDFLQERPFNGRCPVFIGDDRTDEHGFALVNRSGGWSVKVGPGSTCARYRLPDVVAVRGWLAALVAQTSTP